MQTCYFPPNYPQFFATLGPEERPILSQRDRRMGRRVVLYSSVTSQPASQPATRTTYLFKIFKVEYFINPWSDLPQILHLSLGYQPKIENCFEWRRPPKEDDLKILKVEYLSNPFFDLTEILNLSVGNQTKISNCWNEDNL
jgi:hypothetical protein